LKKILAILVVLALVGGGGGGAYFYFMKPAEASQPDGEQAKKHAEKKEKDKDKSKHTFVELDVLTLPIISDSGVTQTVSMVVAIEVADEKAAALIESQAPRLRDAYIQKMYGLLYANDALKDGVIQVSAIKAQLNEISHKVLGADVVEDVLLQVVQQRPV
jgi:flagellar FliL protein